MNINHDRPPTPPTTRTPRKTHRATCARCSTSFLTATTAKYCGDECRTEAGWELDRKRKAKASVGSHYRGGVPRISAEKLVEMERAAESFRRYLTAHSLSPVPVVEGWVVKGGA